MTTDLTLDELIAQVGEHFAQEQYAEGLALAEQQMEKFPEKRALINYWRICLAARLGDIRQANQILEETLAGGVWYAEEILRESPSLQGLQGVADFERLVTISRQMREADPNTTLPVLAVHAEGQCGKGDDPCPLLLFLHANDDTARANLPHWQSAAQEGWLVVMPQSQRAMWADAYAWFDHESAAAQIEAQFAKLVRRYNIDAARLVVAGFSMGGEVALWLALSGRVKARGFILLGPGGPLSDQPDGWAKLIESYEGEGLRGTIMMGTADETIPQESVRELARLLNAHGVACQLEEIPDLGHEYPADFEARLRGTLDFILGN